MLRALRDQYPGAVYHVMARGDEGKVVFETDENRSVFLARLEQVCAPNHPSAAKYSPTMIISNEIWGSTMMGSYSGLRGRSSIVSCLHPSGEVVFTE